MVSQITVSELKRSFPDIIDQVDYQGKSFDIKLGGKVIARLIPAKKKSVMLAKDLEKFLLNGPRLDDEDAKDFEEAIRYMRSFPGSYEDKWN